MVNQVFIFSLDSEFVWLAVQMSLSLLLRKTSAAGAAGASSGG